MARILRCTRASLQAIGALETLLNDPTVDQTGVPTQLQNLYTTYNTLDYEELKNVQWWQGEVANNPGDATKAAIFNKVDGEYRGERIAFGLDEAAINKVVCGSCRWLVDKHFQSWYSGTRE